MSCWRPLCAWERFAGCKGTFYDIRELLLSFDTLKQTLTKHWSLVVVGICTILFGSMLTVRIMQCGDGPITSLEIKFQKFPLLPEIWAIANACFEAMCLLQLWSPPWDIPGCLSEGMKRSYCRREETDWRETERFILASHIIVSVGEMTWTVVEIMICSCFGSILQFPRVPKQDYLCVSSSWHHISQTLVMGLVAWQSPPFDNSQTAFQEEWSIPIVAE